MNEVLLVAGMALVTFGVRYSVLVLVGRMPLPQPLVRALRFVPPAVLCAGGLAQPQRAADHRHRHAGAAGVALGADAAHFLNCYQEDEHVHEPIRHRPPAARPYVRRRQWRLGV